MYQITWSWNHDDYFVWQLNNHIRLSSKQDFIIIVPNLVRQLFKIVGNFDKYMITMSKFWKFCRVKCQTFNQNFLHFWKSHKEKINHLLSSHCLFPLEVTNIEWTYFGYTHRGPYEWNCPYFWPPFNLVSPSWA
jgi:hypothetical protein